MTENINPTIIEKVLSLFTEDEQRTYSYRFDMYTYNNPYYDPLYSNDGQKPVSKDYYIEPFRENPVLDQIDEIKNSLEYLIMYRLKGDPKNRTKSHHFVPCKYANLKPDKFEEFKDINIGWKKTDDGLYKSDVPYILESLFNVQGMRIKDNALFLETTRQQEIIKVVDVPTDIKKPSREKWLKGVAYTLISDPDNISQYVRFVPTFSRIDIPVSCEVFA